VSAVSKAEDPDLELGSVIACATTCAVVGPRVPVSDCVRAFSTAAFSRSLARFTKFKSSRSIKCAADCGTYEFGL
jgi:hypothetical protein